MGGHGAGCAGSSGLGAIRAGPYYLAAGHPRPPAEALVERAALLDLSVPEMTALIGGLWVLGANHSGDEHGVFTDKPGTLNNAFFVNLVDMSTVWTLGPVAGVYQGKDRATGTARWTATPVDLIFGSNSELRAIAEFYPSDDARESFVSDFVKAWIKVMRADRFGLG